MIIVRLLSPEPWLVSTTEAYSGVGADIVMESISLKNALRRDVNSASQPAEQYTARLACS